MGRVVYPALTGSELIFISTLINVARRTPIIESRRFPPWQVHGAHICRLETGLFKYHGDGPVEIATAGQLFPDWVESVLPASNILVRCCAMFAKNQFSTGFQNPFDLFKGHMNIGNSAHGKSHQNGVSTVVLQRNRLGTGLNEFSIQMMFDSIFLSDGPLSHVVAWWLPGRR
jgi:hypothetical protein